jgi:hypothetical protein
VATRELAARLGLHLRSREDRPVDNAVCAGCADLLGWLRHPRPGDQAGPLPFLLVVPDQVGPTELLQHLQGRLPAASERAQRSGVLSATSLRSRVARLRRS